MAQAESEVDRLCKDLFDAIPLKKRGPLFNVMQRVEILCRKGAEYERLATAARDKAKAEPPSEQAEGG